MPAKTIHKLNQVGMTPLHKAGLAGLYLTLRSCDLSGIAIPGLTWALRPDCVELYWTTASHSITFSRLIESAFRIEAGFIRLPGLEKSTPTTDQSLFLNEALLQTFLQFGPHRRTGKKQAVTCAVEGDLFRVKDFAPIESVRHQHATPDFVEPSGALRRIIRLANWLYPGASQRHVAHGNTRYEEPFDRALPLLFAPIGVIYYGLRSRLESAKARVAMIVPNVCELEAYAKARLRLASRTSIEMTKSNAWDAVLDLFSSFNESSLGASACRIWTFGVVEWNEKQKSRTATFSLSMHEVTRLDDYRLASALFPARWRTISNDDEGRSAKFAGQCAMVWTSSTGELVAQNIATGKPWFASFADLLNREACHRELSFEALAVQELAAKASYPSRAEALFLRLCQGAWRRLIGRLKVRAASSLKFERLLTLEKSRIPLALRRARDSQSFMAVLVGLWTRHGGQDSDRKLARILHLLDGVCWRRLRDLAALATLN